MQRSAFSFPDWIHDFIPDDSLFAHAYDDISDRNRALLKTNIARLYDYYGPNKETVTTVSRRWASGLCTETTREVVDFAIILFDASLLSPARLLASLVPALACGVRNVLAVRIADGSTWPTSVLTGLELAGQELVVEFYEAQVRQLFNEIRDGGASGAVTVLGPKAAAVTTNELRAASRISFIVQASTGQRPSGWMPLKVLIWRLSILGIRTSSSVCSAMRLPCRRIIFPMKATTSMNVSKR